MLKYGSKVRLMTFNKRSSAIDDCDPNENYWLLIGETGTIIKQESNNLRVLVQFDNSVILKGLHCHNKVKNSLLILASDLKILS
jgi:hypothetical protein